MPEINVFQEIFAVLDTFQDESDRGAVLVATSYLEDKIGEYLRASLTPGAGTNQLFDGGNPPLGTFSAKIAACHALGLINDDEFRRLNIIRRIRNQFAHQWIAGFDDQAVSDRCKELKFDDAEGIVAVVQEQSKSGRDLFLFAAMALFVKFNKI